MCWHCIRRELFILHTTLVLSRSYYIYAQTNKQTNKLTAEHYTPAAHARARGNEINAFSCRALAVEVHQYVYGGRRHVHSSVTSSANACERSIVSQSAIPSVNLSSSEHKPLTMAGLMCESSSEVKCIRNSLREALHCVYVSLVIPYFLIPYYCTAYAYYVAKHCNCWYA